MKNISNTKFRNNCYIARVIDNNNLLIQDIISIDEYKTVIEYTKQNSDIKDPLFRVEKVNKGKFIIDEIRNIENAQYAILFDMRVPFDAEEGGVYFSDFSLYHLKERRVTEMVTEFVKYNSGSALSYSPESRKEEIIKKGVSKILQTLQEGSSVHDQFIKNLENFSLENKKTATLISSYRGLFNNIALIISDILTAINKINKTEKSLTAYQEQYNKPETLKFPTNQITRNPFFSPTSPEAMQEGFIVNKALFESQIDKPVAGAFLLLTIPKGEVARDLDLFDFAVYSAYYTSRKVWRNEIITFDDLAALLPHKPNINTKTPPKFMKEIENSINYLRNLDATFDFTPQVKNQMRDNQKMKDLKEYKIQGHLIEAQIRYITKKRSSVKMKGLVPLENSQSILFDYSDAMNEFATIPVKMLETPLNLTKENAMIHLYLAYQIANMPYHSKQKLLNISESNQNKKAIVKTPEKDRTISVKSIFEQCQIDIPNTVQGRKKRSRILKNVDELLEYWKNLDLIKDYKIIKGKGRQKIKYIIIPN